MRDTFALAMRLMIFALVAALLLALVNAVTEERIAENTRAKVTAARQEVIGDYAFEDAAADISGAAYITGVYRAMDGENCVGYVYELESRGYGGTVYICAGVDLEGHVTGVKVSNHVETKGLGTDAEKKFMAGFVGIEAASGEALKLDAMSGATISSNAVKNAVDEAITHFENNYTGGEVEQ